MSGFENQDLGGRFQPAHVIVRCSGISEDGPCGREQLVDKHDDGVGVRVVSSVSSETDAWLASFGWRLQDRKWLCPFCSSNSGELQ
jgi:hypothetical protein